jgi:predicted site-specific integrase-resolvase
MKPTDTIPASTAGYLTPSELRQRWKVSGMFLWRLRRDGKLKITKFGSRGVRIAMSEIERIEREAQA